MSPLLEARRISKKRGREWVVKEVEISIPEGSIFGIIGMSGAGKSTVQRLLSLAEEPCVGQIFFKGEEVTQLRGPALRAFRKRMGVVTQHLALFSSRTVFRNIAYPLEIDGMQEEERRERVKELLGLVGLALKAERYPAQLSGGERQRVAIARALARKPEVLFCDEATSALDPRTTHAIVDLLGELNRSLALTIVLITHEMEVLKRIASHVAVMDHGAVIENGRVEELFAHPSHPVTRHFVQHTVHDLPPHLLRKAENASLLRLCFKGARVQEPLISRMVRKYEVEVNILLGGIDMLHGVPFGSLVVELRGGEEERREARSYLEGHGVLCEEILA